PSSARSTAASCSGVSRRGPPRGAARHEARPATSGMAPIADALLALRVVAARHRAHHRAHPGQRVPPHRGHALAGLPLRQQPHEITRSATDCAPPRLWPAESGAPAPQSLYPFACSFGLADAYYIMQVGMTLFCHVGSTKRKVSTREPSAAR